MMGRMHFPTQFGDIIAAQRWERSVTGRMHFPTQFGDIIAAQRWERGVTGRMHMGISAYGGRAPGAGSPIRMRTGMPLSHRLCQLERIPPSA
ncbi:hypothetical protein AGMMS49940_01250 [Spirochaetia bacterium]|nr:hypothetical protein AGMMS49940_01250 [Spirochaetia bacterium]